MLKILECFLQELASWQPLLVSYYFPISSVIEVLTDIFICQVGVNSLNQAAFQRAEKDAQQFENSSPLH